MRLIINLCHIRNMIVPEVVIRVRTVECNKTFGDNEDEVLICYSWKTGEPAESGQKTTFTTMLWTTGKLKDVKMSSMEDE